MEEAKMNEINEDTEYGSDEEEDSKKPSRSASPNS
jgi:hypothetical protein